MEPRVMAREGFAYGGQGRREQVRPELNGLFREEDYADDIFTRMSAFMEAPAAV